MAATATLGHILKRHLHSSSNIVHKFNGPTFSRHFGRPFHITTVRPDIDTAAKYVACGSCVVAAGGSGAGIGFIFGGLVQAIARNPSLKGSLLTYAFIGVAMTEAMAFVAVGLGMTILLVL